MRGRHAAKRLAEQRKAATGKAREAAALAKDLAAAEGAVADCAARCARALPHLGPRLRDTFRCTPTWRPP